MSSISSKVKKIKLWKKNPYCYLCGVETVLPGDLKEKIRPLEEKISVLKKEIERITSNMATIDHLYTRFDPRRNTKPQHNERRQFLACKKCNFERGKREYESLPFEVIKNLHVNGMIKVCGNMSFFEKFRSYLSHAKIYFK